VLADRRIPRLVGEVAIAPFQPDVIQAEPLQKVDCDRAAVLQLAALPTLAGVPRFPLI
jgi:hypothetical protein